MEIKPVALNRTIISIIVLLITCAFAIAIPYILKGDLSDPTHQAILWGSISLSGLGLLVSILFIGFLWKKQIRWDILRKAIIMLSILILIDGIITSLFVIYPDTIHYSIEKKISYENPSCSILTKCSNTEGFATGCESIYASDWGYFDFSFIKIHKSVLGGIFYIFLMGFFFVLIFLKEDEVGSISLIPMLAIVFLIIFSFILIYILAFVLETFCIQCVHLHILHFLLLFLFSLFLIKRWKNVMVASVRNLFKPKSMGIHASILVVSIIFAVIIGYSTNQMTTSKYENRYKSWYIANVCSTQEKPTAAASGEHFDPKQVECIEFRTQIKEQFEAARKFQFDLTDSPYKGSDDIGITVVVYKDFQCPACYQLNIWLDRLWESYDQKFRIYFKFFPLENECNPSVTKRGHLGSCYNAFVAFAAHKIGKFWRMHDVINEYNNTQHEEPSHFNADVLKTWKPDYIGATPEQYNEMLQQIGTDEAKKLIDRDGQDALDFDEIKMSTPKSTPASMEYKQEKVIGGTPTVFINGVLIHYRLYNPNDMNRIIEELRK